MTLIFFHMPRTGGTTLSRIIRRYIPDHRRWDHDRYNGGPMAIDEVPGDVLPTIDAALGHIYAPDHRRFSRPHTCVTVLRNPVDRVLSHYAFVYDFPGFEWVRGLSVSEFVCRAEGGNNFQTALLSRQRNLGEAIHLLKTFTLVGTTERFNATADALADLMGWPRAELPHLNSRPGRLTRSDLSSAELALIEQRNSLDMELWEFGGTLMN